MPGAMKYVICDVCRGVVSMCRGMVTRVGVWLHVEGCGCMCKDAHILPMPACTLSYFTCPPFILLLLPKFTSPTYSYPLCLCPLSSSFPISIFSIPPHPSSSPSFPYSSSSPSSVLLSPSFLFPIPSPLAAANSGP